LFSRNSVDENAGVIIIALICKCSTPQDIRSRIYNSNCLRTTLLSACLVIRHYMAALNINYTHVHAYVLFMVSGGVGGGRGLVFEVSVMIFNYNSCYPIVNIIVYSALYSMIVFQFIETAIVNEFLVVAA